MGHDDVFPSVAGYYDGLVAHHGDSPRSCDYGDPRSQAAKFAVLAAVEGMRGARLLDLGCGLAHFADHLDAEGMDVEYVGADLSGEWWRRPASAARTSTSGRPTCSRRISARSTSSSPTASSTCWATTPQR